MALAQATGSPESFAHEHGNRSIVKEGSPERPTFNVFRVAFDSTSPEPGDFAQSALKGDGCDPFTPSIPIYKKAGDPPIRKVGEAVEIVLLVLDAGKLVCLTELTPTDGARARLTYPWPVGLLRTLRHKSSVLF